MRLRARLTGELPEHRLPEYVIIPTLIQLFYLWFVDRNRKKIDVLESTGPEVQVSLIGPRNLPPPRYPHSRGDWISPLWAALLTEPLIDRN